jgi:hypothetical protein
MDTQGEWVNLQEGSQRLDTSIQTLRRRIKAQQIKARQVASQHGPSWEVWVPIVDQKEEATESELVRFLREVQEENRHLIREFQEKLEDKQQEIVQKTEVATMWQARAEMLGMQLQQAQQTIKMLEAPKVEIEEGSREETTPWWKFW